MRAVSELRLGVDSARGAGGSQAARIGGEPANVRRAGRRHPGSARRSWTVLWTSPSRRTTAPAGAAARTARRCPGRPAHKAAGSQVARGAFVCEAGGCAGTGGWGTGGGARTSMQTRPCLSSASRSHFRLGFADGREGETGSALSFERPSGSHGRPLLKGISMLAPVMSDSVICAVERADGARIGPAKASATAAQENSIVRNCAILIWR